MYANKIITITRVSLYWNTAYTPCHYTDTIRLHWLTDDTRLLCTVLQVIHNYIVLINRRYSALTYRWFTFTLYWFTGDTRFLWTDLQVIHFYTALTYRYTWSHCTDLRLTQDLLGSDLQVIHDDTQLHCTDLQVIQDYSALTYRWYMMIHSYIVLVFG